MWVCKVAHIDEALVLTQSMTVRGLSREESVVDAGHNSPIFVISGLNLDVNVTTLTLQNGKFDAGQEEMKHFGLRREDYDGSAKHHHVDLSSEGGGALCITGTARTVNVINVTIKNCTHIDDNCLAAQVHPISSTFLAPGNLKEPHTLCMACGVEA